MYDHENKNNNEIITPFDFVSLFYLLSLLYQDSIYSASIKKETIFGTLLFVRALRAQKGWVLNARAKSKSASSHSLPRNPRDRKSTVCPIHTRRRRIKCPIHFIWSTRMTPSARWRCVFRPKRARTEEKGERRRGGSRWKYRRSGSDQGFTPLEIRRGLDCISRYTDFSPTFA